jgi:pimeloyl-ACP methyl ester carboxylesterase
VRLRTVTKLALGTLVGAYTSVQAANAVIRRYENIEPDAIERPGGMFYLRGVGMHFLDHGSGPVVLLLHGFGGSIYSFRHQIGTLAERHRVLAVDLPGFGLSDRPKDVDLSHTAGAERIREFLDRMGVERATVMGASMGGAIAARLAAAHPERVERLILAAGAPPDYRPRLPLFAFSRPLMPVPFALLVANPRFWRRQASRLTYDPSFVTDEIWTNYQRPSRIRGSASSVMRLLADVRRDVPLDPATVRTRTLLLWGEADPVLPLTVAHRLHATMPDARLEVIPRAGHLVLEEQPDASNASILRFLAERAATPAGAS